MNLLMPQAQRRAVILSASCCFFILPIVGQISNDNRRNSQKSSTAPALEVQRLEVERQRANSEYLRAQADKERADTDKERAKAEQQRVVTEQERNVYLFWGTLVPVLASLGTIVFG